MHFYPNSYGTSRSAIREHNDCNLPAGVPESKGGQFGKRGECGGVVAGPQSTGEKRQPGLQDTKTGGEKFQPTAPPKRGLHQETPEETVKQKGKPKAATGQQGTVTVTDNGGAETALQALGVTMSLEEVAQGMVSQLAGDWRIEATGSTSGRTATSQDPEEQRERYENDILPGLISDAEDDQWATEKRQYSTDSQGSYYEVGETINYALGEDRALPGGGDVWDARSTGSELTPEQQDAFNHTSALAELVYDQANSDEDIIKGNGSLADGAADATKAIVDQYLKDNPDAMFLPFPTNSADQGGDWLGRGQRKIWSKYYNDDDGMDQWRNAGLNDGLEDEVKSFEEWYEQEFGQSPSDWNPDEGDIDEYATVRFDFYGTDGSFMTRTFSIDSGELHVHHDYFTGGTSGDGIAKQLFKGSVPTYDQMGVRSISTSANIDIGSYSWARYGFEVDSPEQLSDELKRKAEKYFTGMFEQADWDRFNGMLADDDDDKRFHWGIADLKFYTTPEKAKAMMQSWMTTERLTKSDGSPSSGTVFNNKIKEEAEQGIVSVGRILMSDNAHGFHTGWGAKLDLQDVDQVRRLEGYIGRWRGEAGQQARAAQQVQRQTQAQATQQAEARRTTFNTSFDRMEFERMENPKSAPYVPRDEVWSAMETQGLTFEKALAQARSEELKNLARSQKAAGRRFEQSVERVRAKPVGRLPPPLRQDPSVAKRTQQRGSPRLERDFIGQQMSTPGYKMQRKRGQANWPNRLR